MKAPIIGDHVDVVPLPTTRSRAVTLMMTLSRAKLDRGFEDRDLHEQVSSPSSMDEERALVMVR